MVFEGYEIYMTLKKIEQKLEYLHPVFNNILTEEFIGITAY